MHKYSRMELGCAIMTVERKRKICRMHKSRKIRCVMTVENERKFYAMHKNGRKEPQLAIMTVENATKV